MANTRKFIFGSMLILGLLAVAGPARAQSWGGDCRRSFGGCQPTSQKVGIIAGGAGAGAVIGGVLGGERGAIAGGVAGAAAGAGIVYERGREWRYSGGYYGGGYRPVYAPGPVYSPAPYGRGPVFGPASGYYGEQDRYRGRDDHTYRDEASSRGDRGGWRSERGEGYRGSGERR
jgi:hypothetical protein